MKKHTFLFVFFIVFAINVFSQPAPDPNFKHAPQEAVEAWKDLKFGLRIHWGLYCMDTYSKAGESWKLNRDYVKNPIGYQKYQDYIKTFNPTNYNPNNWLDMMVKGGMTRGRLLCPFLYNNKTTIKYIVTNDPENPGKAKIVEAPANWHYSVMESPYGKDITKMLIDATLKRQAPNYAQGINGFKIGLYYTDIDWYDADFRFGVRHPLYPGQTDSTYRAATDPEGYKRAHKRLVNEVAQICQMVPKDKLLSICFDMSFPKYPECDDMLKDMVENARSIQPNTLFRNRAIGKAYGDYYTPERTTEDHDGNWMSIYPLGKNFDYDPNSANYKGAKWIIQNLVDIVARGGLFQIGIGPGPDGTFHPTAVQQIEDAGKWLEKNHECIYSTRSASVTHEQLNGKNSIWYTRTKDCKYTYIMCKEWPGDALDVRKISADVGSQITMLADPEQTPVSFTQDTLGLHLTGLSGLKGFDVGCGVWVFKVQGRINN